MSSLASRIKGKKPQAQTRQRGRKQREGEAQRICEGGSGNSVDEVAAAADVVEEACSSS